jgi:hypothetical protein
MWKNNIQRSDGMVTTAHIGLTLVEQAQAQKEVTVNTALHRMDALLNTGAKDKDLTTPPATPAEGNVYIVGATPSDAWAGHAGHIAYFQQIWRFIIPNEGMSIWVDDEDRTLVFDGSAWIDPLVSGVWHCLFIQPDMHITPTISNGCAPLNAATTSSASPDRRSLDFNASSVEYAQIILPMPKRWNKQGLCAQFIWSHASASASAGVVWSMESTSMSDGSSLLNSYGARVSVTDTGGNADTLYISPTTAQLTPAGTLSDDGLVAIRISRTATDSADTLSMDARMHGVRIFYGVNRISDL